MSANFVNSLGLVFDIAGVLVVWFFGLTKLLTAEGEVLTTDFADGRNKPRIKRHKRLGKFGMFLILLGFALQLVSNCL
jgi:hypothetical protein